LSQEKKTDNSSSISETPAAAQPTSEERRRHALLQWLHRSYNYDDFELPLELCAQRPSLPTTQKLEEQLQRAKDADVQAGGHSGGKLKIDKDGRLVSRKSTEGD
jgi:hypothetical protein